MNPLACDPPLPAIPLLTSLQSQAIGRPAPVRVHRRTVVARQMGELASRFAEPGQLTYVYADLGDRIVCMCKVPVYSRYRGIRGPRPMTTRQTYGISDDASAPNAAAAAAAAEEADEDAGPEMINVSSTAEAVRQLFHRFRLEHATAVWVVSISLHVRVEEYAEDARVVMQKFGEDPIMDTRLVNRPDSFELVSRWADDSVDDGWTTEALVTHCVRMARQLQRAWHPSGFRPSRFG